MRRFVFDTLELARGAVPGELLDLVMAGADIGYAESEEGLVRAVRRSLRYFYGIDINPEEFKQAVTEEQGGGPERDETHQRILRADRLLAATSSWEGQ